jgi:hypothetical protein
MDAAAPIIYGRPTTEEVTPIIIYLQDLDSRTKPQYLQPLLQRRRCLLFHSPSRPKDLRPGYLQ